MFISQIQLRIYGKTNAAVDVKRADIYSRHRNRVPACCRVECCMKMENILYILFLLRWKKVKLLNWRHTTFRKINFSRQNEKKK